MKFRRKLLVLPPVLAGIGLYAAVLLTGERQVVSTPRERATLVRSLRMTPSRVVPTATGLGSVEPARTWRAAAEVAGRVLSVHPRLEVGEILPEGSELLRIDPSEYELRAARLEADLRSIEAERDKLRVGVENTDASLEVARASLAFADRELARLQGLGEGGVVSTSSIDAQEQAVLRERAAVVELESAQRTAAADEAVFDARHAATAAQLAEARLSLERTAVVAPFDLRIVSVTVQESQFVAAGAALVEADGIEVAEVQVALSVDDVRRLLPDERRRGLLRDGASPVAWDELGIDATVRFAGGGPEPAWAARLARVAGFTDASTRTVTFVAAVDNAYRGAAADGRPPLVRGMFVEVAFRGGALEPRITVPRHAVRAGSVFVVDAASRLETRPVEIDFFQDGEAVVRSGLSAGDEVVVTDLVPAIPGMLLSRTDDAR
ncbi:MAG: HlyD family efflux transporter periplasmic adaptor subunit [Planctomycetota bacterium]